MKVTSAIALIAIWTIFLVPSLSWAWSVLFITWAVLGVRAGETFLIGQVRRNDEPLVFWLVTGTWFTMGVLWPFL